MHHVPGPARILVVAELAKRTSRRALLVLRDSAEVELLVADGQVLVGPNDVNLWPHPAGLEQKAAVLVSSEKNLSQPALEPFPPEKAMLGLEEGGRWEREEVVRWLEEAGYERVDLVTEPGEYSVRGGIVDVFPEEGEEPVRAEFADEVLLSLRRFDPLTQRSVGVLRAIAITTRRQPVLSGKSVAETVPAEWLVASEVEIPGLKPLVFLAESEDILPGTASTSLVSLPADFDLGCLPAPKYSGNIGLLVGDLAGSYEKVFVAVSSVERQRRLTRLLPQKVEYVLGNVSAGFICPTGFVLLTERELYGFAVPKRRRRRFRGVPVDNLTMLRPGDLVVHAQHGIGRFEGVRRLVHAGTEKDYLTIRYAGNDRLYVPVENLASIDRYIGAENTQVQLDRIGGRSWLLAKARAARATAQYAEELLELEARRSLTRGFAFGPDTDWQLQLEAAFPYEETEDQLRVIEQVKRDMESGRPMERLVCGEVGYGKTEVALRAAFKAVCACKQVALLAPTTILACQHFETFCRRLESFPVRVEMLSRFVSPSKRGQIITDIAEGKVDIVIGTHSLLGEEVRFRDLGLLIIDEEQKFGVRQKERLKKLYVHVDILSLTATPVPRTLYLALAGLRDISNINTPPPGRREVLTEVAEWSDDLVVRYVERELARDGQVFFVHNRIASLPMVARRLEKLFPGLDMAIAHGQMSARRLQDLYLSFAAGKYKMLLSTAIIESGLDLPNVNTIIVDRADSFGLADLHQLRGRVGRSGRQAYALFLVPATTRQAGITPEARKRLSALLAYTRLGSGFRLAMRDLEIRGAGELLGTRQHGHIARVGLNLYASMLREAAARLKGEALPVEPELALEVTAFFPEEYVPDSFERVALYRRLLTVRDETELNEFRTELVDRFGRYPSVVENLFLIAQVRIIARRNQLLRVELKSGRARLVGQLGSKEFSADLEELVARMQQMEQM